MIFRRITSGVWENLTPKRAPRITKGACDMLSVPTASAISESRRTISYELKKKVITIHY